MGKVLFAREEKNKKRILKKGGGEKNKQCKQEQRW